MPHFRYEFAKEIKETNIGSDVKDIFNKNTINFLFFGNINVNKGIDILMNAYNMLPPDVASKANLIVAGKDYDGVCRQHAIASDRESHLIFRHINDDELIFIYQNADVVCLPYRKTSQSGILEMAFYFKKPILTTDVPYFKTTLDEFPSFGKLIEGEISAENYSRGMSQFIMAFDSTEYYSEKDFDSYMHRNAVSEFIRSFKKYLYPGTKYMTKI